MDRCRNKLAPYIVDHIHTNFHDKHTSLLKNPFVTSRVCFYSTGPRQYSGCTLHSLTQDQRLESRSKLISYSIWQFRSLPAYSNFCGQGCSLPLECSHVRCSTLMVGSCLVCKYSTRVAVNDAGDIATITAMKMFYSTGLK